MRMLVPKCTAAVLPLIVSQRSANMPTSIVTSFFTLEHFESLWNRFVVEVLTHPVHVAIELLFGGFIIYYYFALLPIRKGGKDDNKRPTPQEEQELIDEFSSKPFEMPKSMAKALGDHLGAISTNELPIELYRGRHVTIDGKSVVNAATFDFLSMSTRPEVLEVAERTICEYGVGSCGPRGFYGSLKPHIDLESHLAQFLGTHSAITYSYSFATTSTLIPCFSSRGDEILVDEACCLTIQQGCFLSRSHVTLFKHNDMADLERLMAESVAKSKKKGTLPRRFVVTEGIFRNTGDIAPLDKICALDHKYKFRLILDDCFGFGVLGATGRGTPEHFKLNMEKDVDIYNACMSGALGSVGGFCASSYQVVDHQRLAATGYVFSASLPPYCSVAASKAMELIGKTPGIVKQLQSNAHTFRAAVAKASLPASVKFVNPKGSEASPLVHFHCADVARLRRAATFLLEQGFLAAVAVHNHEEKWVASSSLRIALKSEMTVDELNRLAAAVTTALSA